MSAAALAARLGEWTHRSTPRSLADLIGGATVAGGVVLDLRMRSGRERRRELETVVADIERTNRHAVKLATVGSFNPGGFGAALERVAELTGVARRLADAAGKETAGDVRDAAADLSDMWLAIAMRAAREVDTGREPGEDKTVVFTLAMPVRRMNVALYGEGRAEEATEAWLSGRLTRYYEEGLSAAELDGEVQPSARSRMTRPMGRRPWSWVRQRWGRA